MALSLCAYEPRFLSAILQHLASFRPVRYFGACVRSRGGRISASTRVVNLPRRVLYSVLLSYAILSYPARDSRDSAGAVFSLGVPRRGFWT